MADRIVLNKCDLLTQEALEEVEQAIRELNESVPLFKTVRSEIDVHQILDIHAYDNRGEILLENHKKDSNSSHLHLDETVSTVKLTVADAVDPDRLKEWLGLLLWEHLLWDGLVHDMDIWRVKGTMQSTRGPAAATPRTLFVQGVCELFDVLESDTVASSAAMEAKIVVIGRRLDPALLQASLDRTVLQTHTPVD